MSEPTPRPCHLTHAALLIVLLAGLALGTFTTPRSSRAASPPQPAWTVSPN